MGFFRSRKKWKDKTLEERVEWLMQKEWLNAVIQIEILFICLILLTMAMDLGWI